MIPYFILLGVWIAGAVQLSSRQGAAYERILYITALLLTTLMVGLRDRVGGDWGTYEDMYYAISFQTLQGSFQITEPGYAFLNWMSAKVDGGVYIANLGCAILLMLGLSSLVRRQAQPWLAMMVAIPYLVIVVGMGYTRQAAAIGVICWAISTIEDDAVWKTVAKIAFAALFHKTAILFLPILLIPLVKRNVLTAIVGGVAFLILAQLALRGASDQLYSSYVNSNYQASGAGIRVAMNVAAAMAFFVVGKRFELSPSERLIWTIMAGLAIVSVAGLAFSSSSVGVDRLSLFLIPLQVFVYGNIAATYSASRRSSIPVTFALIFYSCAVQYVYFFHGSFSYTWLPYRNILLSA